MMMKQKFFVMFAATMLLLCMVACTPKSDNPANTSQQELEQSVVGVWCEEFDYKDVTEESEGCTIHMAGDSGRGHQLERREDGHAPDIGVP